MSNAYIMKSATVEWETPQSLFDQLNEEFAFTLDVAATPKNAKTDRYFTKSDDGLNQSWDNEVIWCNPPYGRQIADWVKKASETKNSTIVMLVPVRTDTKWFHDYVYCTTEIRFIKGRLKFGGAEFNAPFPNMLIIWRN